MNLWRKFCIFLLQRQFYPVQKIFSHCDNFLLLQEFALIVRIFCCCEHFLLLKNILLDFHLLLTRFSLALLIYQLMMNKLKNNHLSQNFILKSSRSRKFEKIHSKIGAFIIHSQTTQSLPQKRHQHLFKNNYVIYILLPQKDI